jgi:hypothetical protein
MSCQKAMEHQPGSLVPAYFNSDDEVSQTGRGIWTGWVRIDDVPASAASGPWPLLAYERARITPPSREAGAAKVRDTSGATRI